MNNKFRVSFLLIVFLMSMKITHATNYYIDSGNGNNTNSGLNESSAWKDFTNVNYKVFNHGDCILLKRDQSFTGTLAPRGSGSSISPITIGAYGVGTRPIINFGLNEKYGVWLENQSHIVVKDLEVAGAGKGVLGGQNFAGIFVSIKGANIVQSGITIDNCVVHDVAGQASRWDGNKTTGLISFTTDANNSYFDNVLIDNCMAYGTERWAGIVVSNYDWGEDGVPTKNKNITIRNCKVQDVWGDGIVIFTSDDSVIEHCIAYDIGLQPTETLGTSNAIWTWNCTNAVVQYCEAYNTHSPGVDGGGFDIDFWNVDNVVQYSYAHDCDGYGIAIFGAKVDGYPYNVPTKGSIVRYNIFSNNGRDAGNSSQGDFRFSTWSGGSIDGFNIYNNTTYWNPVANHPAIVLEGSFTGNDPKVFKNNIIIAENGKIVATSHVGEVDFNNNIYWWPQTSNGLSLIFWNTNTATGYYTLTDWQNASNSDGHSLNTDPLLNSFTYHGTNMPITQFTPQANSPAIDAGANVGNMGNHDFAGNVIPSGLSYDIGAMEYQTPSSVNLHENPRLDGAMEYQASSSDNLHENPKLNSSIEFNVAKYSNSIKLYITTEGITTNQLIPLKIYSINGALLLSEHVSISPTNKSLEQYIDFQAHKGVVYLFQLGVKTKKVLFTN